MAESGKRARRLLRWAEEHREEMIAWIQRAVEMESPSRNQLALDAICGFLAREFRGIGGEVETRRGDTGSHLLARFAGRGGGRPLLLIGHHDTVWELGTLAVMPFRRARGRLWGPGVLDMKAGLAQMLFAIRALQESEGGLRRPVLALSVSDEEIGSCDSRPVTEKLARGAAAALVLEPAQGLEGALKTARKGAGEYRVRVRGRAAHSGVNFPQGASAVVELARQIGRIAAFNGLRPGVTVNPGVIRGGTRTNVVAAEAEAVADIRVCRAADAVALARKFRSLKPFDRRCKLEVEGGLNRPPMERTRAGEALFAQARALAAAMDGRWRLRQRPTGGASDGNFTAVLGVPTLDGLGAVGEGAHAVRESVLIRELPRRTALLAALMAEI